MTRSLNASRMRATHRRSLWCALAVMSLVAVILLAPSHAWADGGSDTGAFERYAAKGPFVAILASFVVGLVSSLTPCVYPMVPVTVAIFGATETPSRARGAALSATFVLGIATLFTPLGVISALSGKLLGSTLANPFVVVGIAILFFALASSMFGAFEMALPASLNNKLSTVGGVGYKGAFVLGMAMGLIAAPCTGPFVTGLATYLSKTRDVVLGGSAMFAFAVGLGVLFFIAGTFAVALPKSGAWMLGIKWGSGVVLAYMALAYLRDRFSPVHDLVVHSSVGFGVTATVLLVLGLVLGGIHIAAERRRSPIAHLSKPMKLASIVPAIVGAFLFVSWIEAPAGGGGSGDAMASTVGGAAGAAAAGPIAWQGQEDAATKQAIVDKKPVIIDFGAGWCAACKELDAQTWPDARVRAEASRFVAIKIDATDDDDPEVKRLETKYKVVGLPTVVVLGSDGSEKIRYNEFVPAEKIVPALKPVM